MRTSATFLILAGLAGCMEPPNSSNSRAMSAGGAQLDVVAADYPKVTHASPSATNYAPPGWPLEVGDTVTEREWRRLDIKYGGRWGMAVVWVVSESGPAGALPFGAGFDYGGIENVYVGHLPVRFDHYGYGGGRGRWVPELESAVPVSLRGVVDVRKHIPSPAEWDDFRSWVRGTPGGLGKILTNERRKYYGPGASW